MNKYYGDKPGPCLWEGKKLGIVTTCGYPIQDGAGVFEEGMKRYSKHSKLEFIGMIGMQDNSDRSIYESDQAKQLAKNLVDKVM